VAALGAVLFVLLLAVAGSNWYEARRAGVAFREALVVASQLSGSLNSGFDPAQRTELASVTRQVGDLLIAHLRWRGIAVDDKVATLNKLVGLAELLGHPTTSVNLGDVSGSVHLLSEAVPMSEALYAEHPENAFVSAVASQANRCLGALLIERGDYVHAAQRFERALVIDGARLGLRPNDPVSLTDYADSLANLSRIHFHERNAEECLRLGKEAVKFRRKASEAAPGDPNFRKDLGHGLSNYCADLVEFGRYRETLDACRESDQMLPEVLSFPPVRRVSLRLLANNAEHVGRAYAGLGRGAEAIASFQESVRRLRQLEAAVPIDTLNRRHLARCLSRLAEAQAKAGQRRQARFAAAEAVQFAEEAATADPSNAKEKLALEEIRRRVQSLLR
jgi:tetratricopeptide (TPR) repeat protein